MTPKNSLLPTLFFTLYFLFFNSHLHSQILTLTDSEYLHSRAVSVLAFHNTYPVGMQGGIEIIHHEERVATNGRMSFRLKSESEDIPGVTVQHHPIPKIDNPERETDVQKNIIKIPFRYEQIGLRYHILITPGSNGSFTLDVNFEEPVRKELFKELYFEMDFYPEAFAGKSFISNRGFGRFPFDFTGAVEIRDSELDIIPMASGKAFTFAPDDPLKKIQIMSSGNEIILEDDRWGSQRMWFKIKVKPDLDRLDKSISLTFRPNIVQDWRKPPMLAISQAGYHPDQPKRAIIEMEKGSRIKAEAKLYRLEENGDFELLKSAVPELWGDFLRYTYGIYDFSGVREEGLYRISFKGEMSHTFEISETVYSDEIWRPVLETFMPVQMCHMSVRDRGRLWHAVCHLDDAVQAPAPLKYFDGFSQSDTTDTPFIPKTTIPGLNIGGWHDAGDDDVNTGSNGRTIYHLALAIEEFGVDTDQTTVDFKKREVHLHRPDGVSDAMQQLIHGVQWLVAQYRQLDHSIVGVISSSWETYLQTSDWGVFTDNLFYDPSMSSDEKNGTHSGKFDDRYAFTNKDTRREYMVAAILAASSRVLAELEPDLAEECIITAEEIWRREKASKPIFYPSVGTPWNLIAQRANAAVELFLSTGDDIYKQSILAERAKILEETEECGWTISRIIDRINDTSFITAFHKKLNEYSEQITSRLAGNPFGIETNDQVWGIAWNILWHMQKHYYLIKSYPDLFPREHLYDAVQYALGVHPGSNLSLVSSVGTHRPIPAFGINRSDYSYIPGGVYSGPGYLHPDYPELKDDHPYLWQQSEYIISGATPYIFCVLATESFLNKK